MSAKIEQAARELLGDALEIANDDAGFRSTDWNGFCRVMWSDDADRKRRGLSRDEYEQALRYAWELLPEDFASNLGQHPASH